MPIKQTLQDLQNSHRQNFIDYNSFVELHNEIDYGMPTTQLESVPNFELSKHLKQILKDELYLRSDREELMGLAAVQVGIPANVIYIEKDRDTSVLLMDPKVSPSQNDKDPELFIKLIKCPTSPSPYHLGLFIKSATIYSATSKPYALGHIQDDPTFNFSANLQKVIWAASGFLPGDDSSTPINYLKACELLDGSPVFKKHFKCSIHRLELEQILNKSDVLDSLSIHKDVTDTLRDNLLKLFANNTNKEWIRVPSENLFKDLLNI